MVSGTSFNLSGPQLPLVGGWDVCKPCLCCCCCPVTKLYPTFCNPMQHARLPCPSNISRSLLKFMSIESVMPSNHLVLCCPFSFCLQPFPASRGVKTTKGPAIVLDPGSDLVISFMWLKKRKSKTLSQANHLNRLGEPTFTWAFQGQACCSVPCRPLFLSKLAPHPRRDIRFPSAV